MNLYGFVGNYGVGRVDLLGLAYHSTSGACKLTDPCPLNFIRLLEWSREATERWAEAIDPVWIQAAINNIPFKPGEYFNPKVKFPLDAYKNHFDNLLKANTQCLNCVAVLYLQESLGLCGCLDSPKLTDWLDDLIINIRKLPNLTVPVPVPVNPIIPFEYVEPPGWTDITIPDIWNGWVEWRNEELFNPNTDIPDALRPPPGVTPYVPPIIPVPFFGFPSFAW